MIDRHFDAKALQWFARSTDPSLALLDQWSPPEWRAGRASIEAVFGLEAGQHFLGQHRGLFPQLWERQLTQALQALLLEYPARALERCQSLLIALEGPRAPLLSAVDGVTADGPDGMDLAIHCRDADGTACCVVIEAKLQSELSRTQLIKYRRGLLKRYPDATQRHLFVVAPTRTLTTAIELERPENSEWRFLTWRRLLIDWQKALPDEPGSDALALFAEIWKRSGGC